MGPVDYDDPRGQEALYAIIADKRLRESKNVGEAAGGIIGLLTQGPAGMKAGQHIGSTLMGAIQGDEESLKEAAGSTVKGLWPGEEEDEAAAAGAKEKARLEGIALAGEEEEDEEDET